MTAMLRVLVVTAAVCCLASAATPSYLQEGKTSPEAAERLAQATRALVHHGNISAALADFPVLHRPDFDTFLQATMSLGMQQALQSSVSGPGAAFAGSMRVKAARLQASAPAFLDRLFAFLDQDHDGTVTHAELHAVKRNYTNGPAAVFAFMDVDGDGFLTTEEMSSAVAVIASSLLRLFQQALDVPYEALRDVIPVMTTFAVLSVNPAGVSFDDIWSKFEADPGTLRMIENFLTAARAGARHAASLHADGSAEFDDMYAKFMKSSSAAVERFTGGMDRAEGMSRSRFAELFCADVSPATPELAAALGNNTAEFHLQATTDLSQMLTDAMGGTAVGFFLGPQVASGTLTADSAIVRQLTAFQVDLAARNLQNATCDTEFDLIDRTKDGILSLNEYRKYGAGFNAALKLFFVTEAPEVGQDFKAFLHANFAFVDASDDGLISGREPQQVAEDLAAMTREMVFMGVEMFEAFAPYAAEVVAASVVAAAGHTRDGAVTLEELVAAWPTPGGAH